MELHTHEATHGGRRIDGAHPAWTHDPLLFLFISSSCESLKENAPPVGLAASLSHVTQHLNVTGGCPANAKEKVKSQEHLCRQRKVVRTTAFKR
jgi:hypothetical protein